MTQPALQSIKDDYARENYYNDWNDMYNEIGSTSNWLNKRIDLIYDKLAMRYTEACCKATLEKAANNTYINQTGEEIAIFSGFDKSIILNPSNIVIL